MRRAALVISLALLAACSADNDARPLPSFSEVTGMEFSSPDIPGDQVPREFTCQGQDVSPALRWSGLPEGTVELAISVKDPDAPGRTFLHWTAFGIDPATKGVERGSTPAGAQQGRTDFGSTGWRGPCPPAGPAHRYVFTLYALSSPSGLETGASGDAFDDAMAAHGIGTASFTARYARA